MPGNDIEAFDYVVSDKDTALELDYLTYAMFAYKKQRWIEHFISKNNGTSPTQVQIDAWISQLTDFDFTQMRNDAGVFFDDASREYLKNYIEEEKQKAVDASILSKVKEFTNPWRDLGIALLMAILAPVLLGLIVFGFSLFDKSFPVHVTFGGPEAQSVSDGKAK
jgi:hypothetical protein